MYPPPDIGVETCIYYEGVLVVVELRALEYDFSLARCSFVPRRSIFINVYIQY